MVISTKWYGDIRRLWLGLGLRWLTPRSPLSSVGRVRDFPAGGPRGAEFLLLLFRVTLLLPKPSFVELIRLLRSILPHSCATKNDQGGMNHLCQCPPPP